MKKTVKTVCALLLGLLFIIGATMPTFAATESGKISVLLEDEKKNKINGVTAQVCKIADINGSGYYPSEAFQNSGISISGIVNASSEATAKDVQNYIENNGIKTVSKKTQNGKAVFSGLNFGIWLVFCKGNDSYTFNPYFVFLPYESGGNIHYEITTYPKVSDLEPDLTNIYVIKKWDDNNNAAAVRPKKVTIELLRGKKVVDTAELSEQNGWAHTFNGVSKKAEYSVKEKAVKNYTAEYSGDAAEGFIVTNSYNAEKLPQTGQLWWPITIIFVVGIAFLMLGVIEIGARKNGKKNK